MNAALPEITNLKGRLFTLWDHFTKKKTINLKKCNLEKYKMHVLYHMYCVENSNKPNINNLNYMYHYYMHNYVDTGSLSVAHVSIY